MDDDLDLFFSQLRDAEWATQREVNVDEAAVVEDELQGGSGAAMEEEVAIAEAFGAYKEEVEEEIDENDDTEKKTEPDLTSDVVELVDDDVVLLVPPSAPEVQAQAQAQAVEAPAHAMPLLLPAPRPSSFSLAPVSTLPAGTVNALGLLMASRGVPSVPKVGAGTGAGVGAGAGAGAGAGTGMGAGLRGSLQPNANAGNSRQAARTKSTAGGSGGGGVGRQGTPRGPVPFYKRVPGTSFTVDAFQWTGHSEAAGPGAAWFLTHFHADHYGGLKRSFNTRQHGHIYCSPVTARLLSLRFGLGQAPHGPVHPLPFNTPVQVLSKPVHGAGGQAGHAVPVRVTLLDANHCPGAAMMLFEVPVPVPVPGQGQGVTAAHRPTVYRAYLHTGDMRWDMRDSVMAQHPALLAYCGRHPALLPFLPAPHPLPLPMPMSAAPAPSGPWATAVAAGSRLCGVYLDTTYASSGRSFPSQRAAVAAARHLACTIACADPGVLLLFGSYSIGKERLFLAVAAALGEKIYAPPAKLGMLRAALAGQAATLACLTSDPGQARIHVVPMAALTLTRLQAQLRILQAHAASVKAAAAREAALHTEQGPPYTPGAGTGAGTEAGQQGAASLAFAQLVNRNIRAQASASAAVAAIGSKRKLPAAVAVTAGMPGSRGGGGVTGGKRVRGRGGGMAALLLQSRAAAALSAHSAAACTPQAPAPGAGGGVAMSQTQRVVHAWEQGEDGEEGEEGAGFLPAEPVAAPAPPTLPTPRTFHSILAFRPTGWVHAPGTTAASAPASAPTHSTAGRAGMPGEPGARALPVPGPAHPALAGAGEEQVDATQLHHDPSTGLRRPASAWARTQEEEEEEWEWEGEQEGDWRVDRRHGAEEGQARAGSSVPQGAGGVVTVKRVVGGAGPTGPAGDGSYRDQQGPQCLNVSVPSARAGRLHAVAARACMESVRVPYAHAGSGVQAQAMIAAVLGEAQGGSKRDRSATAGTGCAMLFSVPYSEHSSFDELRQACAVLTAGPALPASGPGPVPVPVYQGQPKIIPTVGCRSAQAARAMVEQLTK